MIITIRVDSGALQQLIESAEVRAEQFEGKHSDYTGEEDRKVAFYIRECIARVKEAMNGEDV
jgi:hypothetical protein